MLKKITLLLISLVLAAATLCSCAGLFGDDNGAQNKPSEVVFNKIITNDSSLDLLNLKSALSDIVGPAITVNSDSSELLDGEIVIGDTGRAITAAAKAALESELSGSTKFDCGYIIYTDGKSIALYWQIEEMSTLAINKFIDFCINEKRLELDSGTVTSELFSKAEYETEKYWLNLASEASDEVVAAFKRAYSYYDGSKMVDWIANLYDSEIGGFYYSISARDYEPFRPDIESTSFALSLLVSRGAIKNRNTELPVEMQIAMVDFMKNMQSAKDGYFYHPQWPQDKAMLKGDRYGRDIASAASFITSFYIDRDGDGVKEQQRPTYCAPGTAKCEKHYKTNERCSFPQSTSYIASEFKSPATVTLTSGVSAAVSKVSDSTVTPTASVSGKPDYSSADAFREWLLAYNANVKTNSGQAHNIAELRMEIIDHGYMNIVLDHLDAVLEEVYNEQLSNGETPSGAWQYDANFKAVWGIYKYLCLYNLETYGRKIDIKYVPYMVDTCIKVIGSPADETYYVNDVMNQWTSISRIISNVEKHYGVAEAKKIQERVRENAVYLIDNTLEKIEPFRVGDGSYAYTLECRSLSVIYGVEISRGEVEGDLNSTVLATGTYTAMYNTMGYTQVPLCNADDGRRFVETILTNEPIEKKEQIIETLDFEDTTTEGASISARTPEALMELRDDPTGEYGKSLYFVSGKASAQADSISFPTISMGSGCNVLETDIYIDSETDDGYLYQVKVGESCYFAMYKNGKKLSICAMPTFDSERYKETVVDFLTTDEWFKLRIEYYMPDGEILTAPITKIFIDGEFVTFTEVYNGSHTGAAPSSSYSSVNFYSMRLVNTYTYFDNCYFAKETKMFDETNHTISDSRGW
ncbi:MAG: hypothetical protein IJW03_03450 [Clostridia bacterium]|nr:hypothetical protein [Clostridia bacterium]